MMRWGTLVLGLVAACTTSQPEQHAVEQGLTMCPDQVVEGLDVYTGTGTIDWAKVQASGRGFAFIKATQGDYNMQATFAPNWANALAAGVKRSPYHFFDGTIDGVAQANTFLAELQSAGGLQVGDLPALLDIECPTSSVQSSAQANCEHTGDSGWVDRATLAQRIYDWLDTVQAATGRAPILYSYPSWFAAVQMTDARLATYPLFIASYNSCATIPQPWTSAVFWQYSATGTVPGVTGNADVDRFFGSAADLDAFTIQPAPQPDAGMVDPMQPPPAAMPTGCGCRGSSAPPLWSAAALVLLLLRRGRTTVSQVRRRKSS
ncbi:MAG: GH25 family lysozyme [Kofleriaceae bacterium]